MLSFPQEPIQAPTLKGFKLGIKAPELGGGYQVFQENGKIQASTREEWVRQQRAKPAFHAPKGSVKVKTKEYGATFVPGDGVKAAGGELFPVDVGEWGGGIYFVKNQTATQISTRNTSVLEKFDDGIYAFQSLAHMMFSYADLVKLEIANGKWTVKTIYSFKESETAIECDGDHFVILIGQKLLALYPDGKQRELVDLKPIKNLFYYMTILKNHQIWLGGTFGVSAFVPQSDGTYEHFSYVPLSKKK